MTGTRQGHNAKHEHLPKNWTVSIIGTERGGEFKVRWRRHGSMLPTRGELSCQRGFDCWQGNRRGCACGRWGQRECFPCTFVQVGLSWNQILVTACVDRVPYHCDSLPLRCHEAFWTKRRRRLVYIVSAPQGKGKTSFLSRLVESNEFHESFGGILALSSPEKHEYYAKNIETGEIRLLMSDSSSLQGPSIGRFSCRQETFDWASKYLLESKMKCMVIDEVGGLELKGMGYAKALRALLGMQKDLYIAVRSRFVDDVVEEFGIKNYELVEASLRESQKHICERSQHLE